MKIEMIAVYILVAAFVIVPYIAIIVFGSGKEKKINKNFKNTAKAEGLSITEKESWNRHILGLDKEKRVFLFVQHDGEHGVTTETIDLNQVVSIDVFQKYNVIKVDNKRAEVLDSLGLDFLLLHDQRVSVRFYDTRVDVSQNYEREHAEKWRNLLLDLKKTKEVLRNTAAA